MPTPLTRIDISMPFPKTIGKTLEKLSELRARRVEFEADVSLMKAGETALEDHVMKLLKAQKLTVGAGGTLRATIEKETYYNAEDWDKVYAFIVKNDAFDLLHKRLGARAVADRFEAGVIIPGIKVTSDVEVLKLKTL